MTIRTQADLLMLFPDNSSGLIAPSSVRDLIDSIRAICFPVGCLHITADAQDPAIALGFGVWTQVSGRVLVGVDVGDLDFDTPGKIGGAKSVVLTEAQIPAHTHIQNAHSHGVTDPGHTHLTQRYPTTTGGLSGFTADTSMNGTPAANTLPTASGTTGISVGNATAVNQNAGGGQAHDNMPPYYAAYIWRRTA